MALSLFLSEHSIIREPKTDRIIDLSVFCTCLGWVKIRVFSP